MKKQQDSTPPHANAARPQGKAAGPSARASARGTARRTKTTSTPKTSPAARSAPKPRANTPPRAKTTPPPPPRGLPAAPPDLYASLHALLHTMRLIERHEEPLCSMHDELKRTGKLSAPQRRKLQQLVQDLPAHEYQADLDALRQAVSA